jgi:hypothetical protein
MSLYVPYYRPYNKHNTNIHAPGGISVSERPQTHALDRTATGIGKKVGSIIKYNEILVMIMIILITPIVLQKL